MDSFYKKLQDCGPGKDAVAVTVISGPETGKKYLLTEEREDREQEADVQTVDAQTAGEYTAGSGLLPALREVLSGIRETCCVEIGGNTCFCEPVTGRRRLILCGAGHVSLAVIPIAKMLQYEVTVLDEREEYTARAAGAGADRVISMPYAEGLKEVPGGPRAAFVVATRAHIFDVDCLREILNKGASYIGVVGSRNRAEKIREKLLGEGEPEDVLNAVHMPVGLPIGSETPEEIAVSILAEIISVLNAEGPVNGFPKEILDAVTGGQVQPCVLAVITAKYGSAPRRPGSRMLVYGDGSFIGTLGGGWAEARILQLASDMLREGGAPCRLERVSVHAEEENERAMFCGGEFDVFLEVL